MIPSGPGYAGTQDAAAIIGIKALGGTGAQARRLPRDAALRASSSRSRSLGLVLLAARYGGLGELRGARRGLS